MIMSSLATQTMMLSRSLMLIFDHNSYNHSHRQRCVKNGCEDCHSCLPELIMWALETMNHQVCSQKMVVLTFRASIRFSTHPVSALQIVSIDFSLLVSFLFHYMTRFEAKSARFKIVCFLIFNQFKSIIYLFFWYCLSSREIMLTNIVNFNHCRFVVKTSQNK